MIAIYTLFILCMIVAVSEWLTINTVCKHLGTALLVIIFAAMAVNSGLMPTPQNQQAANIYNTLLNFVAPLSIIYLLLQVNLRQLKKAGTLMLGLFLLGSIGTLAGVAIGVQVLKSSSSINQFAPILGGMFAGTYTGGSLNFNALAIHFEMTKEGNIFASLMAVDNILTTLWMIVTLAIPKFFQANISLSQVKTAEEAQRNTKEFLNNEDNRSLSPMNLALTLGCGMGILLISKYLGEVLASKDLQIPNVLIFTTITLILAQFSFFHQLKGLKVLSIFGIYLFLAGVSAYCDLSALAAIGNTGTLLFLFATTIIFVHGVFIFLAGRLVCKDWTMIAIASQANIGGSTTAMALANSLNRTDLVLPGILAGIFGNALGTYLGFMMTGLL